MAQLLVVDDDPEDLLLITTAVKRSKIPFQVRSFRDGEEFMEALDLLQSDEKELETFSSTCIVFLDLNMPKKDGRSCLRDIRRNSRLASIPIIVFSTSESGEDITNSYELGANSYICKPDDLASLEKIISEVYRYWFSLNGDPYGKANIFQR
ncbi:response regulator [Hahella ganghwensis]|uniref:response regulator n=1 Tax=Hahella ganghwensis TaxID=286420 RepID=UPI0012FC800D|nr:response regulator [Hahella ganghwensis]